jgi:hypothetical protein
VFFLHYIYRDLRPYNRTLAKLAIFAGLVSLLSIGHSLQMVSLLSGFAPETLLTDLPTDVRHTLWLDNCLRIGQLGLTLSVGCYILWWLYLAFINILALEKVTERNLKHSASVMGGVLLGLLSSLKMIRKLWQQSKPLNPERRLMGKSDPNEGRWVLLIWWILLMVANVVKVTAVYRFGHARDVASLHSAYDWIMAAYVLYMLFYYFSYRLTVWISGVQMTNYHIVTRPPMV